MSGALSISTQHLLRTLSAELASLDMPHKITTADVLHHEVHSCLCLETSMQICQKWMSLPVCDKEDPLLGPSALDLVILNDELLLENLDSVKSPRLLGLCQHDLAEITLAEHSQEVEVIKTDALSCARVCSRRERLPRRTWYPVWGRQ